MAVTYGGIVAEKVLIRTSRLTLKVKDKPQTSHTAIIYCSMSHLILNLRVATHKAIGCCSNETLSC